jgi:D-psicose/D-tagatose/L-ribulose 3-epimerase
VKLAISNIAWNVDEQSRMVDILRGKQVSGIEIAPTMVWPEWRGASVESAAEVHRLMQAEGFTVPALQAILFGRPDLKVFGSEEERRRLLKHLSTVAELARVLGARVLVFGSPRNRDPGDLTNQQAFHAAVSFFRSAGEVVSRSDVRICIEPNPEAYNCRFVTNWRQAEALVRAVNHPGFRLHLDSGCIYMAGDDPVEAIFTCADIMAHFHISEPELSDFRTPVIAHARIGTAIAASGYNGWLSIEMRRSSNPLESVTMAVERVREWYPVE